MHLYLYLDFVYIRFVCLCWIYFDFFSFEDPHTSISIFIINILSHQIYFLFVLINDEKKDECPFDSMMRVFIFLVLSMNQQEITHDLSSRCVCVKMIWPFFSVLSDFWWKFIIVVLIISITIAQQRLWCLSQDKKMTIFLSFLSGSYLVKKFKVNEYYMHLNVNDDDNFWFFFLPVCSAVFFCSLKVDVNIFFYIAFIIVNLLFVPRSSIYLSIF